MAEQLRVSNVDISYGDFKAVRGAELALAPGEIGCLLGPSGCGKTTLLRSIAGFEPVTAGEIRLHDRVLSSPAGSIPPEQRRVGMVFQDFALFPHLDVRRNIGFGLSGLGQEEQNVRIDELLQLVDLADHGHAYPHELSGGQQQRVALARALAPSPEILLLDEPFSSLDSELREQLAAEVGELLRQTGTTAILVTHDRHEAFAMADRIAVMEAGQIVQFDSPQALYTSPATPFVATFIAPGELLQLDLSDKQLQSHVRGLPAGAGSDRENTTVLVRPGDVIYDPSSALQLTVRSRVFRGDHMLYQLALADGQHVQCRTAQDIIVPTGSFLPVRLDLHNAVIFNDI